MDKKKEYMEYIKGQIEYFDRKSIKEKRRYYLFSIIALVSNAVIPILSTFSSMPSPYKQIVAYTVTGDDTDDDFFFPGKISSL